MKLLQFCCAAIAIASCARPGAADEIGVGLGLGRGQNGPIVSDSKTF